MTAEPAPLAPHTLEGVPATLDEKKPTFSKELTTPEHVALEMKENPKSIRARERKENGYTRPCVILIAISVRSSHFSD
ncbi:hypothetical protein BDR05DRAFT_747321 [Suillus weaverae]|nr:hypothetical protein BDR05DRAFT_747321 [Suillus weaverae]